MSPGNIGTDIERAASVLRAGGLVAFPTETVYGLGADAASDEAVAKVFALKGRPRAHPLIAHVAPEVIASEDFGGWAREISPLAHAFARSVWPGPLTVILLRGPRVANATTGGSDTIGIRVPAHPMALALIRAFGGGIAAPSANRFGAVSPTTAAHVIADLGSDVDYVLDGGPCTVGVESTIIDLTRGVPVLLRPGGVPRVILEAIAGPLVAPDAYAPAAPGTLVSHYAPNARVIACVLADVPARVEAERAAGATKIGVLAPRGAFAGWGLTGIVAQELPDDDAGMARELYAALRDLDAKGVDVVVAALPPAAGLGEAVGDRLVRAAGPRDK